MKKSCNTCRYRPCYPWHDCFKYKNNFFGELEEVPIGGTPEENNKNWDCKKWKMGIDIIILIVLLIVALIGAFIGLIS